MIINSNADDDEDVLVKLQNTIICFYTRHVHTYASAAAGSIQEEKKDELSQQQQQQQQQQQPHEAICR